MLNEVMRNTNRNNFCYGISDNEKVSTEISFNRLGYRNLGSGRTNAYDS